MHSLLSITIILDLEKNGMKECNGRQDWKKFYLYRGIVDKFETHFVVHLSVCQCDCMMNV